MTAWTGERWEILPALRMQRRVLFPGARCCVVLETLEAYGAVVEATRSFGERALAVFAARARLEDAADGPEGFHVGTAAEVVTLERPSCCNRWVAELRATGRLRVSAHLRRTPFHVARIERLVDPSEDPQLLRGLVAAIRDKSQRVAALAGETSSVRRASVLLAQTSDPALALGHAMELLSDVSVDEQQRALELPLLSTNSTTHERETR